MKRIIILSIILSLFIISIIFISQKNKNIDIKKEKCLILNNSKVENKEKIQKKENFKINKKDNVIELPSITVESKKYIEPFSDLTFLNKNIVKKYLMREFSVKESLIIDNKIKMSIDNVFEDSDIEKIFLIKDKKVVYKIIKDSIIHYYLTKGKTNLFADNSSDFNNIMIRAILLSAIAERETGFFNYDPTIFSSTKAFGRFQINGNTLGFSFLTTLKTLNLNLSDFSNKDYRPSRKKYKNLYSKAYKNLLIEYYKKGNKSVRKNLFKYEDKFFKEISYKLFSKMNLVNFYNKDIEKYTKLLYKYEALNNKKKINFYKYKLSQLSKKQLKNIEILLKRTIYGVEKYSHIELNKKCVVKRRLAVIEISADLIESSLYNQGVYSLIVAQTKYDILKNKGIIKNGENLKFSFKDFYKVTKYVTMYYNGGEDKNYYGISAAKHSLAVLENLQKEEL